MSRQELADAVGVNYQTIGFLERGEYGPSLKLAFADRAYFGLPVEALFSTEPLTPLSQQVYAASNAAKEATMNTEYADWTTFASTFESRSTPPLVCRALLCGICSVRFSLVFL